MKITIVGVGYVGFCTGAGFALKGHDVTCVMRTPEKAAAINAGRSPLYEPGLDDELNKIVGRFRATTDMDAAVASADAVFIAVGTPCADDGSIDLTDLKAVSAQIGTALKNEKSYKVIVVKSTVVAGTTEEAVIPALEQSSGKKAGRDFGVCMNPEFLREGRALEDFLHPDRIVIGELDKQSGDILEKLYAPFSAPVLRTSLKTAEMIKYVSNSFLALKISFANEIGNLCHRLGMDPYEVFKGVGMDSRISPHFFQAGIGWGGSCFGKDVSALMYKAKISGNPLLTLESTVAINKNQRKIFVEKVRARLGSLNGKKVAVLGLAFKADTDDIRESPAIDIIRELQSAGATVTAYDPKATENFRKLFPQIAYAPSAKEALQSGTDACLILTDWQEFRQLTQSDFPTGSYIIEGRKALDQKNVRFEGICW